MNKTNWIRVALASLLIMTAALAAQAQANRTFVRSNGVDSGTCPASAPCLTFNFAHGVTNAGGEIVALDSGGFGQVTITKAITIEGSPGIFAFIKAQPGTAGITVAAGVSDVVVIRNIQFGAQGGASTTGIQFNSGKALFVDECNFSQITTAGVGVANTGSKTQIEDSSFVANGVGLKVTAGRVRVQRSTFTNNTVAVRGEGDGGYSTTSVGNQANPPNGPTGVFIAVSVINDNTTAFEMHNAGFRPTGVCNGANIFLHINNTNTNFRFGNTTYVNVTGSTELNAGCTAPFQFTMASYSDQQ